MSESTDDLPDVSRWSVALFVALIVAAVAVAVAAGASTHACSLAGLPLPAWAAVIAFSVQWCAFVPAYLRRTEHFYDLVGGSTYLTLVIFLVALGNQDPRSLLLGAMIGVWALRLASFLFMRVRHAGHDRRFDEIKQSGPRFFIAWHLQGLWVFLTMSAAIAAMSTAEPASLGMFDVIGLVIWLVGFGFEVVADRQKSAFREANKEGFITSGLWAWSRHPNYFGEIVLWIGVAIVAASTLNGWQWVTMISPVFVVVLLTKISGLPPLEERADERWGGDPDYQRYKSRTPILVPRPPRESSDG